MNFSKILLEWYVLNKRELPWRNTDNPYLIWLSEIILQQTRVEQGLPYYLKFVKAFPTINDLAGAEEDKVLKFWQGLGYYSRARNLHHSARYIIQNHNGIFPKKYSDILNLKGVGSYTAAAIASFSFGLPYAVVDGNVIRVLSRVFGIETPSDSYAGKKKFQKLAQALLSKRSPAENNQAIMDFGAIQCVPKSPKCNLCPFIAYCIAYETNSVNSLPVKVKKNKPKNRFLHYLFIQNKNGIVLEKRRVGVWKGLYELPFLEYSNKKTDLEVLSSFEWLDFFKNKNYKLKLVSEEFVHKLSHQHIYAKFWIVSIGFSEIEDHTFVKNSEIKNYPVSRLTDKFLNTYSII